MKGALLAGGEGTRLGTTKLYNKQLALVYDRAMIEYPAETLQHMGADSATVVSTFEGANSMLRAYGHDINGLEVDYVVQPKPNGSADALGQTMLKGVFPVLCGDVYFDPPPKPAKRPTLYYHEFEGAQNHSVWDPETNTITEKPVRDIGKRAIVAYYYDERIYDVIPTIQPSLRGELELVDLHKYYLAHGADVKEYKGFFGDMGSPDGLLRVANHVQQNS